MSIAFADSVKNSPAFQAMAAESLAADRVAQEAARAQAVSELKKLQQSHLTKLKSIAKKTPEFETAHADAKAALADAESALIGHRNERRNLNHRHDSAAGVQRSILGQNTPLEIVAFQRQLAEMDESTMADPIARARGNTRTPDVTNFAAKQKRLQAIREMKPKAADLVFTFAGNQEQLQSTIAAMLSEIPTDEELS